MGSCCCKEKFAVDVVLGQQISESGMSEESLVTRNQPLNMINHYIHQMVNLVGSVGQNLDEQPAPLMKLHTIADNAEGWQRVISSLINTVPLNHPLGPSAITIIFDDCPLPAVNTIVDTVHSFGLGRERALSSHLSVDNKRIERNMLVVIGCMAEKYAGQVSVKILNQEVMDYLFTFLTDMRSPNMILQALITVEKFGKTMANKATLQAYFARQEEQHPLIPLEVHSTSEEIPWRQIGFCARWLLDNMYCVPGRALSYTYEDMSETNAILDCKDTTDFLKISPDGLEARCDSHTFESVRCTFQVNHGCWYYEAHIYTHGVMQIGWATKETKFCTHEGYGIGDDHFSIAYDGCRCLLWYKASPRHCDTMQPWVPGDILGCLIDIKKQEAIFALNGVRLPICRDIFRNTSEGFYAAASFMCFQGARFNFGTEPFRFAPGDREFSTFNAHGTLSDADKELIPRWLYLQRMRVQDEELEEDTACTICFDNVPDIILSPCRHRGICRQCAYRMSECPMCRERVWHYTVLPL